MRVPRVFDFFVQYVTKSCFECGYLVMEYIDCVGMENLPPNKRLELVPRISTAIKHLASINTPVPARSGPLLDDGIPSGYFWSNYGARRTFSTVDDLRTWLNQQLRLTSPTESLGTKTAELGLDIRTSTCAT